MIVFFFDLYRQMQTLIMNTIICCHRRTYSWSLTQIQAHTLWIRLKRRTDFQATSLDICSRSVWIKLKEKFGLSTVRKKQKLCCFAPSYTNATLKLLMKPFACKVVLHSHNSHFFIPSNLFPIFPWFLKSFPWFFLSFHQDILVKKKHLLFLNVALVTLVYANIASFSLISWQLLRFNSLKKTFSSD